MELGNDSDVNKYLWPKDRGHKAKAKNLGTKTKAKESICQGHGKKKKTKANNDHTVMMTMMNKILVKQENSHS